MRKKRIYERAIESKRWPLVGNQSINDTGMTSKINKT